MQEKIFFLTTGRFAAITGPCSWLLTLHLQNAQFPALIFVQVEDLGQGIGNRGVVLLLETQVKFQAAGGRHRKSGHQGAQVQGALFLMGAPPDRREFLPGQKFFGSLP